MVLQTAFNPERSMRFANHSCCDSRTIRVASHEPSLNLTTLFSMGQHTRLLCELFERSKPREKPHKCQAASVNVLCMSGEREDRKSKSRIRLSDLPFVLFGVYRSVFEFLSFSLFSVTSSYSLSQLTTISGVLALFSKDPSHTTQPPDESNS